MAHGVGRRWGGLVLTAVLACACTATVEPGERDDDGTGTGTGTVTGTPTGVIGTGTPTGTTGTGCGAGPLPVPYESAISECGGFAEATDDPGPGSGEPPAYCDAEVLHWSYDPDTRVLDLLDARIDLNCCGEHSISAESLDGMLIVTERDAPEAGDARCNCMCVFDFALSAQSIAESTILLQLVRHVTDEGDPWVVFEGTLDLTEGSGWVVLDDAPAMFCGDELS